MKKIDEFKVLAKELFLLTVSSADDTGLYKNLMFHDEGLSTVTSTEFGEMYRSAKLAISCSFWVECCENSGFLDKEIKNLFFHEVMNSFESSKSLEKATAFSESLYASNSDEENVPVVAVLSDLFTRCSLQPVLKEDGQTERINPAFKCLVEGSEGFKMQFENSFDDFIDNKKLNI